MKKVVLKSKGEKIEMLEKNWFPLNKIFNLKMMSYLVIYIYITLPVSKGLRARDPVAVKQSDPWLYTNDPLLKLSDP